MTRSGGAARIGRPRGFRQSRCAGCGLNAALCLCQSWRPLDSPIEISVVMPPSEARSASNTSRLLSLWLPRARIHVRGDAANGAFAAPEVGPGSVLLFPGATESVELASGAVRHLVVPDGTWSQARRIERRCFAPLGLPRLELEPDWPSLYTLRRSRSRLCTFEAAVISLGLIGHVALAEALLERFGEWTVRARQLKAGANPERAPAPVALPPRTPLPHPAIARLKAQHTLAGSHDERP